MTTACDGVQGNATTFWVSEVRREYADMPGLSLTLPQARRLFGLDEHEVSRVLTSLLEAGYLTVTRAGRYVRADAR